MRILLVDHGCCDHPAARVHALRRHLAALGVSATVCGPSTVPGLERQPPGMHGIHLHDVAAASRPFLAAVRAGTAEEFVAAVADVPARLLGLVRETARQMIAEAADAAFPDAIFVLHAGILADLAIETGAPVVVHVSAVDLDAAARRPSLRRLVAAALGSSGVVVAADAPVASALADAWLTADPDASDRVETWPLADDCAARIAAACGRALSRRRGA